MSDRMTALLTSYTLCNKAMEHGRVLKEHVTESMFHAGIIVYYSIFKNQREKQWFKSTLSNPPIGLSVTLRHGLKINNNEMLNETLINVFTAFENIRDKNIAHKDSTRFPENRAEWLQKKTSKNQLCKIIA